MIERVATFCHRRRWTVLFAWIVVVIGVTMIAGALGDNDANGGRLTGSDSDKADQIANREFPSDGMDVTAVFHAPDGVAAHRSADRRLRRADQVDAAASSRRPSPFDQPGQVSADGTTAFIRIDIDQTMIGGGRGPDRRAARSGPRPCKRAACRSSSSVTGSSTTGPPASEMFGLLAAVFILLVAFGSVVAMGLPIVTAILGIVTALGGVTLWSHVVQTPGFTAQVASMIGIGVGIDYALFIVTRYRGGTPAWPRRRGGDRRGVRHRRTRRRLRRLHRDDLAARHAADGHVVLPRPGHRHVDGGARRRASPR